MNSTKFFAQLRGYLRRYSVTAVIVLFVLAASAAFFWPHGDVRPPATEPAPAVTHEKTAKPRIVVVIDDVGLTEEGWEGAVALPPNVTLAFLPYVPRIQEKVDAAKRAGHEIFLHLPMQPLGTDQEPGPYTLRTDMDDEELRQTVEKNLSAFSGYIGVNNHMGSRFTSNAEGMRIFMEEVKKRGLIFLDSRTTLATKGEELAREMGVLNLRRHVFLDNEQTEESVTNQFHALLKIADEQNVAVAIGHPHNVTLAVLAKLLPYFADRYELVPASALAK